MRPAAGGDARAIEVRSVSHRFDDREVLSGIDLVIDGTRTAVIGANGSGKSTFARLLNGLVRPTDGTVTVDGFDTVRDGAKVRGRVGFVFQDPDLQIVLPTVAEDLAFGLRPHRLSRSETAAKVDAALTESGLTEWRHHPAHLLSGGQKQMLAISAVTITAPVWLVLDEPTTLLDRRNTAAVVARIDAAPQHVVLVTHNLAIAARFERVIVFDDGRVVADGSPAETIPFYERLTD